MTVKEAAKKYHKCEETIRRWCRAGKLNCTITNKRDGYSITESDVLVSVKDIDPYVVGMTTRLKNLRRNMGFERAEVAKDLGISFRLYADYESGARDIPSRMVAKIANYYDISADWLLGLY